MYNRPKAMYNRPKARIQYLATFVFAIFVVTFTIMGCSSSPEVKAVVEPQVTARPIANSTPTTVQSRVNADAKPAPDFSMVRFDTGETIALSKLRGQPVILDFFASWCSTCRAEAPRLQQFWKAHEQRGLVLLAVALNDSAEGLKNFKDAFQVTYPMGLDETGKIATVYHVSGIPTFVFIDREGRIVKTVPGMMGDDALAAQAETLLK